MAILKQFFNSAASNFIFLLILKAIIICLIALFNIEHKRPYIYTTTQLGIEFMITLILLAADKAKKPNLVLFWMYTALLETLYLMIYSLNIGLHDLYHPINPEVELVKERVASSRPQIRKQMSGPEIS